MIISLFHISNHQKKVGKFVSWQTLSGLCIVAPALMALGLVFMPRSPIFLLSKGKVEEAKKSLLFLRGPDFDVNSELKAMEASLEDSKAVGSISIFTLLTNRIYLMPFIISMVSCQGKSSLVFTSP